jgi:hypothetical protein
MGCRESTPSKVTSCVKFAGIDNLVRSFTYI